MPALHPPPPSSTRLNNFRLPPVR
ncbi:hypothetical protein Taro_013923 [Colocasia esculenta]|uniref:Uncharacterized protein n=1 Tax=Colocasia esculenta TaxID=4460 RepID=A0A843U7S4_COLES|nr:hypothetical protein [Colocasia esculenta]